MAKATVCKTVIHRGFESHHPFSKYKFAGMVLVVTRLPCKQNSSVRFVLPALMKTEKQLKKEKRRELRGFKRGVLEVTGICCSGFCEPL